MTHTTRSDDGFSIADGPHLDVLKEHMKLQTLKYACGLAMFCGTCGTVLDARRSVLLTPKAGVKDYGSGISCARCYDALIARYDAADVATVLSALDVYDGRTLTH